MSCQKGQKSAAGQASLEAMFLTAAGLAFVLLMAGQVGMLAGGVRQRAIEQNAVSLVSSCQEVCQQAVLSGSVGTFRFTSLSEGILESHDGRVWYHSKFFNISRQGFSCNVRQGVRKGSNVIVVSPGNQKDLLQGG